MESIVELFRSNVHSVQTERILTEKGDEIDTVKVQTFRNQRYLGFVNKIKQTHPFVSLDVQSWFKSIFD